MINIKFIVLGNIKESYLRDAIAEYTKRLGAFAKVEICELKEYKLPDNPSQSHIDAALEDVRAGLGLVPPVHLQSPLFKGYKYPHDYPNRYVEQQYLPDDLKNRKYYKFGDNKNEKAAEEYWSRIKGK